MSWQWKETPKDFSAKWGGCLLSHLFAGDGSKTDKSGSGEIKYGTWGIGSRRFWLPCPPPHHWVTHPPSLYLPFSLHTSPPPFSCHSSLQLPTLYTPYHPAMHHSSHTLSKPLICIIVVLLSRPLCTAADLVFLFLSLPLCAPPTQLVFPFPLDNILSIFYAPISSGFRCNMYLHKAL